MRVKRMLCLAFVVVLASMVSGGCLASGSVLRAMEEEFTRIIDNFSPAVVEIIATKGNTIAQLPSPGISIREDVGTGIIIDKKGYIVTTESVVGGAKKIEVNLADGRAFEAKLVGTDPVTDVALIQIDAEELPVASLGNSDKIRTGSWIVSIGRSYGKSTTVSFSVVSGVEPLPGKVPYYDAIKISSSVSPGNSGGGVIDMDGKLVGMIAAVLAEPRVIEMEPQGELAIIRKSPEQKWVHAARQFDVPMPLGDRFFWRKEESFAIPINFARSVIDDLIEYGKIKRGWLGVVIRGVKQGDMELHGLDAAEGVIVDKISDNSPAFMAGLRKGDVIVGFGDETIKGAKHLTLMVAATEPHTKTSLDIIRDKQKRTLSIEIGEMPKTINWK